MPDQVPELLRVLQDRGIATSKELQAALAVSQPTISRLIRKAGDEIVAIGRGPAPATLALTIYSRICPS